MWGVGSHSVSFFNQHWHQSVRGALSIKWLLKQDSPVKCLAPRMWNPRVQPHPGPCSLTSGGIWEGRKERQPIHPLRPSSCFLSTEGIPRTASTLNTAKEGALPPSQCRKWTLCWERNQLRHWVPCLPRPQHSTANNNIQGASFSFQIPTFYLLKLFHSCYHTSQPPCN